MWASFSVTMLWCGCERRLRESGQMGADGALWQLIEAIIQQLVCKVGCHPHFHPVRPCIIQINSPGYLSATQGIRRAER